MQAFFDLRLFIINYSLDRIIDFTLALLFFVHIPKVCFWDVIIF